MNVLHLSPGLPNIIHNSSFVFVEEIIKATTNYQHINNFVIVPIKIINKSYPIDLRISKQSYFSIFSNKFFTNSNIKVFRIYYLPAFGIKALNYLNSYLAWYFGKYFIIRFIKKHKIDAIHAHGLFEGFIATRIKKQLKIPYIMHAHGRDILHFQNLPELEKKQISMIYKNADFVISNSQKMNRLCVNYFNINKIKTIYFGVRRFGESKVINKNNNFQIVLIANQIKQKGTRYLIEAVKHSKYNNKLSINIIGDGEERKNLELLVSELNLGDNVKFLGRLPNDDILNLLNSFNLFVLPAWSEALGVVYLEAMSMGLPVIGCFNEGIAGFQKDFIMLVRPKNAKDIAEKIDFLFEHPDIYERYSKEALEFAKENFSWDKISDDIVSLYKQITN